ncbi:MAG: hypothetical protein WC749_12945, partial [Dehalococcoidia bacterium]
AVQKGEAIAQENGYQLIPYDIHLLKGVPLYLVFRDSAFADDVAKTNLTAILQQHGLENIRSL